MLYNSKLNLDYKGKGKGNKKDKDKKDKDKKGSSNKKESKLCKHCKDLNIYYKEDNCFIINKKG